MDATMIQFFHWYSEGNSKLYDHAKDSAEYLKQLGISAVWFPPAYKANGGGFSVGYDPYDLYDFGYASKSNSICKPY